MQIHKLTVVGNAGMGKTILSKALSRKYSLPLTHVDTIQFVAGMKIRNHHESIEILENIMSQEKWLIDGYGPLDILEKRFAQAEKIIFIDLPIWVSYWWCTKRQIKNLWLKRREELPEGCNEATLNHTLKLFKTIWQVHTKMRPELLRIFSRDSLKNKVVFIRTFKGWSRIYENGL